MAANAGIIKAIISFYHINLRSWLFSGRSMNMTDTAFERHRSHIPIRDDLNTVQAKKAPSFVPWPHTASENLKLKREEKATTSLSGTTNEQWKLELPNTMDDTGSEINSMYF